MVNAKPEGWQRVTPNFAWHYFRWDSYLCGYWSLCKITNADAGSPLHETPAEGTRICKFCERKLAKQKAEAVG